MADHILNSGSHWYLGSLPRENKFLVKFLENSRNLGGLFSPNRHHNLFEFTFWTGAVKKNEKVKVAHDELEMRPRWTLSASIIFCSERNRRHTGLLLPASRPWPVKGNLVHAQIMPTRLKLFFFFFSLRLSNTPVALNLTPSSFTSQQSAAPNSPPQMLLFYLPCSCAVGFPSLSAWKLQRQRWISGRWGDKRQCLKRKGKPEETRENASKLGKSLFLPDILTTQGCKSWICAGTIPFHLCDHTILLERVSPPAEHIC